MSFPRYPSYKDSGVEWLGEVPAHWTLPKLKHFTKFFGGGTPSRENLSFWNGNIPWVSPKDMKAERIQGAEECITETGLMNSTSSLLPAGMILLVVRSGILKHTIPVAINEVPIALNQDMKALSFKEGSCLNAFFLRWVQGLNAPLILAWAKQGATVESIEQAYLAESIVPLPPFSEQQTIAAFLDRETAKIDALIAEQQRLIELLKEKRQAVISHAVTKGLSPPSLCGRGAGGEGVPMKDSGIEWLGEVPAHWDVCRLKHISPQITVGIVVEPSKYYVDEGIPALRSLNVRPCSINLDNLVYISPKANEVLSKSRLNTGDLVVVRSGQPGTTAVISKEIDSCNCIDLIIIRKPLEGSEQFFCWYLNSDSALQQFSEGSGGAIQQHFNIGTAMNLVMTKPPKDEQSAIAAFLDHETAKLDTLTSEAQRAIDLLKERRIALISAAVTGKIDVRGLA